MKLFRFSNLKIVCVAAGLALPLCPLSARAQTFVEVGGGWNYLASAPAFERYTHGSNFRAAFGWQLQRGLRLRVDASISQFDDSVQIATPGFGGIGYEVQQVSVAGLAVNALVNIDPHGFLYAIGGLGIVDLYGRPGRHEDGVNAALSAGLGLAVPIGPRLRAFAEARGQLMLGNGSEPPWLVPIAIGFRY